jgi:hypothetical protein
MFMSKTISAGNTALAASVNAAFTVERRLSEQPVNSEWRGVNYGARSCSHDRFLSRNKLVDSMW